MRDSIHNFREPPEQVREQLSVDLFSLHRCRHTHNRQKWSLVNGFGREFRFERNFLFSITPKKSLLRSQLVFNGRLVAHADDDERNNDIPSDCHRLRAHERFGASDWPPTSFLRQQSRRHAEFQRTPEFGIASEL